MNINQSKLYLKFIEEHVVNRFLFLNLYNVKPMFSDISGKMQRPVFVKSRTVQEHSLACCEELILTFVLDNIGEKQEPYNPNDDPLPSSSSEQNHY